MLALKQSDQSFFVGIRSLFYRVAMVFGSGFLVYFAGLLEARTGNVPQSWTMTFFLAGAVFIVLAAYHYRVLPKLDSDTPKARDTSAPSYAEVFSSYFKQDNVIATLAFILLYRLGEAMRYTYTPDSPLGNWMTDLMRQVTGAQVGLQNLTGIRGDIKQGPITPRTIYNICPFDNSIVSLDIDGKQLFDFVSVGLRNGPSFMQDVLIYAAKGLGYWGWLAFRENIKDAAADDVIRRALFTTITNVNFDTAQVQKLVPEVCAVRDRLRDAFISASQKKHDKPFVAQVPPQAGYQPGCCTDGILAQAPAAAVNADSSPNEDIRSLREILLYGLKGMFGVPGVQEEEVLYIRRKSKMKEVFSAAGIPFAAGEVVDDYASASAFAAKHGFPLVIKPDNGMNRYPQQEISVIKRLAAMLSLLFVFSAISFSQDLNATHLKDLTLSKNIRPVPVAGVRTPTGPKPVKEWTVMIVDLSLLDL